VRPCESDGDIAERSVGRGWKHEFNHIAGRQRNAGWRGEGAGLVGAAAGGEGDGADAGAGARMDFVDRDAGQGGRAFPRNTITAGQAGGVGRGARRHHAHNRVGGRHAGIKHRQIVDAGNRCAAGRAINDGSVGGAVIAGRQRADAGNRPHIDPVGAIAKLHDIGAGVVYLVAADTRRTGAAGRERRIGCATEQERQTARSENGQRVTPDRMATGERQRAREFRKRHDDNEKMKVIETAEA